MAMHNLARHWFRLTETKHMSNPTESQQMIVLRIRRQDRPDTPPRWEEFAVPRRPNMNIIACLQHIAANPFTTSGKQTTPVVYDSGCLEEVCGACSSTFIRPALP
jgi:hypothetical protein